MTPQADASLTLLGRLGRASGSPDGPLHGDVESIDYDWEVPYHFSSAQLRQLEDWSTRLAEGLSQRLGRQLRQEVTLQVAMSQCFAHRLADRLREAPEFCLVLSVDGSPGGLMTLSRAAAVSWVARLLGAAAGEQPDRELTDVESDLLGDIAASLVEVVADALAQGGRSGLGHDGGISAEPVDLPGHANAEYCEIVFHMESAGEVAAVRLAVLCEVLDPLVGAPAGQADGGSAPADARAALIEHFSRVQVTATALAGLAEPTMREVVGLEPGDVLLLPKSVNEPIELSVDGKDVLCGFPVVSAGKVAVRVAQVHAAAGATRPPGEATARSNGKGRSDGRANGR